MENKQRKEELTTEMHSEFIGDEIPKIDLYVMGVYGAIARGVTIEEALKKYGLSREEYETNIDRVLSS
ncbi:MAG: hypothetical protein K1V80_04760 [Muribaculaceae bacterium]